MRFKVMWFLLLLFSFQEAVTLKIRWQAADSEGDNEWATDPRLERQNLWDGCKCEIN